MNTDTTFACNPCPCDVCIWMQPYLLCISYIMIIFTASYQIIELFNHLKIHRTAYRINQNDVGVFLQGKKFKSSISRFYMHISKFIVLAKSTSMSKEFMTNRFGIYLNPVQNNQTQNWTHKKKSYIPFHAIRALLSTSMPKSRRIRDKIDLIKISESWDTYTLFESHA
jgi:hypothetical protein